MRRLLISLLLVWQSTCQLVDVFQVPLERSNAYIISDRSNCMVVDFGRTQNDTAAIQEQLRLQCSVLVGVFITVGDPDHFASVQYYDALASFKVPNAAIRDQIYGYFDTYAPAVNLKYTFDPLAGQGVDYLSVILSVRSNFPPMKDDSMGILYTSGAASVLFASDLIYSGTHLFLGEPVNAERVSSWISTLEQLPTDYPGATVYPGRGPPSSNITSLVRENIGYLTFFINQLCTPGNSVASLKGILLAKYPTWNGTYVLDLIATNPAWSFFQTNGCPRITPVFGTRSNAFIVSDRSNAVIIDTGATPADGEAVVNATRSLGVNVSAIYITHPRQDYFGGVGAVNRAFPSAPLYYPSNAHYLALTNEARRLNSTVFDNITLTGLPDPEKLSFLSTNLFIKSDFASSPAETTSVVFEPFSKTLFAGEVVYYKEHLNLGAGINENNVRNWIALLFNLSLGFDAATVYPGHGSNFSNLAQVVTENKQYLEYFLGQFCQPGVRLSNFSSLLQSRFPTFGGVARTLNIATNPAWIAKENRDCPAASLSSYASTAVVPTTARSTTGIRQTVDPGRDSSTSLAPCLLSLLVLLVGATRN